MTTAPTSTPRRKIKPRARGKLAKVVVFSVTSAGLRRIELAAERAGATVDDFCFGAVFEAMNTDFWLEKQAIRHGDLPARQRRGRPARKTTT